MKNKYIKLAIVMLMLCIFTTCGVSKTFAKYTSSQSASDSARVAKWGVSVLVEGADAFDKEYGDGTATVKSTVDVVAPGTDGILATVDIKGKPEVAVRYKVEVNLDLGDKWKISEGGGDIEYCPIEFKVGDTYIYAKTTTEGTVDALENALEEAIINALFVTAGSTVSDGGVLTKQTNELPGTVLDKNVTVYWKWAFNETSKQDGGVNSDLRDTKLGTLDTMPSIGFALNIEITQLN